MFVIVSENSVKKVTDEEGCWESVRCLWEPGDGYTLCVACQGTVRARSLQGGSVPAGWVSPLSLPRSGGGHEGGRTGALQEKCWLHGAYSPHTTC